jgi:hypothetical protein
VISPVRNLVSIHYPPAGWRWEAIDTPGPTWPDIEQAIRRLDRKEWPIIHLHTCEHVPGREPENMLSVIGGRGEYSLLFMPKTGPEVHYCDESRGDAVIRVWESDQGSLVIERHLCNQLSKVLSIVKHFFENGELDPSVRWEAY